MRIIKLFEYFKENQPVITEEVVNYIIKKILSDVAGLDEHTMFDLGEPLPMMPGYGFYIKGNLTIEEIKNPYYRSADRFSDEPMYIVGQAICHINEAVVFNEETEEEYELSKEQVKEIENSIENYYE